MAVTIVSVTASDDTTDGVTETTLTMSVCSALLVAVTIVSVTTSDDTTDALLDTRFNVE